MSHPAHLAQLLQSHAANLAPTPGSFEEDAALDSIDAARDAELADRDAERVRRSWQRSVAQSVRERRG